MPGYKSGLAKAYYKSEHEAKEDKKDKGDLLSPTTDTKTHLYNTTMDHSFTHAHTPPTWTTHTIMDNTHHHETHTLPWTTHTTMDHTHHHEPLTPSHTPPWSSYTPL